MNEPNEGLHPCLQELPMVDSRGRYYSRHVETCDDGATIRPGRKVKVMTDPDVIRANVQRILARLPKGVELVAAAKTRTPAEVIAAIEAGVRHVGHNYVQEAAHCIESVGRNSCCWHMIGHLQRNKAKKAAGLFDLIETVDSRRLADALERACEARGIVMPVLIEINSGREPQKAGILPEELDALAEHIASLPHLRLEGLMTMGPLDADGNELRKCFRTTRLLFERLQRQLGRELRILSMGMSSSWRLAVEEGATQVRIGTALFGERTR